MGPRLCTKLGPPRLPSAFRIFFQLKVPRVKTAHGVFRAPFTHSARERVWRTGRQRGAGRAPATFTRGPGRKPEGQGFGSDSVGATREAPEESGSSGLAGVSAHVNAPDALSLMCLFAFPIYFPVFPAGFSRAGQGPSRPLSACRVLCGGEEGWALGGPGDKETGSWGLSSLSQPRPGHVSAWRV